MLDWVLNKPSPLASTGRKTESLKKQFKKSITLKMDSHLPKEFVVFA